MTCFAATKEVVDTGMRRHDGVAATRRSFAQQQASLGLNFVNSF
jgi:hypothetical protein